MTGKELRIQICRTRIETYDLVIAQIGDALGTILRARSQTEEQLVQIETEEDDNGNET